jgi:hypothetical protein
MMRLHKHLYRLWGRVTHRHCVKLESVGVYNVDDFKERYVWLSDNIANFTKAIWVDGTVTTYTNLNKCAIDLQLSGQFRFKRQSDALAFALRWGWA